MKAVAILFIAAGVLAAEDVPSWVRDAASTHAPSYPPKVSAVVLLKEEQVSTDSDGRRTMRERVVARALQRGKNSLFAGRAYNKKSGKILDFQAWLIAPSGRASAIPKNAFADISLSSKYEYSDERARVVDPGDLEPGSVFAWEAVEEEKSDFTQYQYRFQEGLPVLVSRFILALPTGWEVKGTPINHPGLEPSVNGNTYTWELRDLPWMEPEDYSPGDSSLVPRLGINFFPSADSRAALRPLRDWNATSEWLSGLSDPASVVTAAIRAKADELTRGASTELERIRAIGAFTQKTNYMAVDLNTERGGGYAPRPADETLARNYGDCKDKAALMRALLDAAGIHAFLTTIYSGDREFVHPEWPSSLQFNHAIIAVRVSAETEAPSVFVHPRLGRLLMFDPTDDTTPLGEIPEDEQGSHALVLAGSKGELITMPDLPCEMNRIESAYEGQLELNGHLSAHLDRHYFGQAASPLRYKLKSHDSDSLTRLMEAAFSQRLGGITMEHLETTDQASQDQVGMKLDLQVKQFGQFMQKKLLVVTPGALVSDTTYSFPAKPRTLPVELEAELRDDKVAFTIPSQFKVDELPDPVKIDSPYGTYRAFWKVTGNKVSFEHTLKVNRITAPASEYGQVREFFEQVHAGQHSAVVLVDGGA